MKFNFSSFSKSYDKERLPRKKIGFIIDYLEKENFKVIFFLNENFFLPNSKNINLFKTENIDYSSLFSKYELVPFSKISSHFKSNLFQENQNPQVDILGYLVGIKLKSEYLGAFYLQHSKFKKECDAYFYLKHRKEPRGIGGIFFDYLNTDNFEKDLNFIKDVGQFFANFIIKNTNDKKNLSYDQEDLKKLSHKRSRYVEFNLLHDRGTLFGLKTGGNIEAILMSMPPEAKWE